MKLEDQIKSYGKKIGLDLVGITTIEPFERIGEIQKKRLALEYLSGFEEQDLEKRKDPLKTMENAKSIIAVGIGYYQEIEEKETDNLLAQGKIARTAWGRDYHVVLREKLQSLMVYIREIAGGFDYNIFVDTGPLSDREVAYRAGLGWFGKNNMLITEDYGTWVFLGYVLTSLVLEPDEALMKQCMGCNLCIEMCPGGALEADYNMNARKCLSYITQTKEHIDERTRVKLGNYIYGCDMCQQVCPHNLHASRTSVQDFAPEKGSHRPALERLILMSNQEFNQTYKGTAAGWRGRNYLRRNAIIAAGNSKNPLLLPSLVKSLKDQSAMIRKYAVWAIHKINRAEEKILKEHLLFEQDEEIIAIIKKYLEGE